LNATQQWKPPTQTENDLNAEKELKAGASKVGPQQIATHCQLSRNAQTPPHRLTKYGSRHKPAAKPGFTDFTA